MPTFWVPPLGKVRFWTNWTPDFPKTQGSSIFLQPKGASAEYHPEKWASRAAQNKGGGLLLRGGFLLRIAV